MSPGPHSLQRREGRVSSGSRQSRLAFAISPAIFTRPSSLRHFFINDFCKKHNFQVRLYSKALVDMFNSDNYIQKALAESYVSKKGP